MEIKTAKYLISNPTLENCPKPDKPEYAFIGRSNVGKSSLINMITNQAKLAKTSGSPGKTQLINHFLIESTAQPQGPRLTNKQKQALREAGEEIPVPPKGNSVFWYLVDLPGYGYAKVSQKQRASWEKMIANYLQQRENLVTVFVLIDSRHNPQALDLEFLKQLGDWGVPFNMVFTKADKTTQREVGKNVRLFINKMKEDWEFIPRSFVTSTIKSLGRRDMLNYIGELNEKYDEEMREVKKLEE